jgi:hypothetical protein
MRAPSAATARFRTESDAGSTSDLTKALQLREEGLDELRHPREERRKSREDRRLDRRREPVADDTDERSDGLDAVRFERFGRGPLDEVSETVRGLLSLFGGTGKETLQEDGQDRLETVRSGEAVDGVSGHTDAFDRAPQGDHERLHLLLRDRLDESVEGGPCRADHFWLSVVEERDQLPNKVDDVVGKVGFGGLAETRKQLATDDTLLRGLVLDETEHVHLQTAETALVVFDRDEHGGQRVVERRLCLLVLFALESALKSVDDVSEPTAEGRAGDADQCGERASVESRDGLGDESRNEHREDLFRADLHDLRAVCGLAC